MTNKKTKFRGYIEELSKAESKSETTSIAVDLADHLGYDDDQQCEFDCDCCIGVKLSPQEDPYIVFNINYEEPRIDKDMEDEMSSGSMMMCGDKQRKFYKKEMEKIKKERSCRFVIHISNFVFVVYDEEYLDVIEIRQGLDDISLKQFYDVLQNPYDIPESERPDISDWEDSDQANITGEEWDKS